MTALLAACGSGSGSFPSFYALAVQAVPTTSSTSSSIIQSMSLPRRALSGLSIQSMSLPRQALSGLSSSYDSSSSDFSTAFSVNQNYIGQVLNDAGASGPVKSMFVLLTQAQSTLDGINTSYSDANGNPTNCTTISGTATTLPFLDSATHAAFNAWDTSGKYTCYTTSTSSDGSSNILLFGRSAIASPPDGCTDAYEYYVASGYGAQNQTNTEEVSTRGSTKDTSAVKRFYYNGCTKDLKLNFTHFSRYSGSMEFDSRSEITGNVGDHTFSLRSAYVDGDSSSANLITIVGTGVSKLSTAGGSAAHFIMGYRSDSCSTASASTCTAGTAQSFCVVNAGTSNSYSLETTTSECASLESAFGAITPLVRADLPTSYFTTTSTAFGL